MKAIIPIMLLVLFVQEHTSQEVISRNGRIKEIITQINEDNDV